VAVGILPVHTRHLVRVQSSDFVELSRVGVATIFRQAIVGRQFSLHASSSEAEAGGLHIYTYKSGME
jgi:hypothetical protein